MTTAIKPNHAKRFFLGVDMGFARGESFGESWSLEMEKAVWSAEKEFSCVSLLVFCPPSNSGNIFFLFTLT